MKSPPSLVHSHSLDFNVLVTLPDTASLVQELRYSIDFCAANRLTQSRKWLSELLCSRKKSGAFDSQKPQNFSSSGVYKPGSMFYEEPSEQQDRINLARALFDLKEYKKCAFVLGEADSPQAVFLKTNANYLMSEQLQEEEHMETGGPKHKVN